MKTTSVRSGSSTAKQSVFFEYSSTREQSNKRCGTRLKTEGETGSRA